jgi:hypothetical protein
MYKDMWTHMRQYVDNNGVKWHLLDCRYVFADWIEQQCHTLWALQGQRHLAQYWVHEQLYIFILLKA